MPESPFGIAQTLEELHIPYQMIVEKALAEPILAQFKVLFVGSASALSDEQLASILNFAKNGGTVMFDTTAATRNQLGIRHGKWPLADIFGFNQPGRIAKATGKAVLLTPKGDIPLAGTSLYYATEFEPEPSTRRAPFTIKFENGAKMPGMITRKYGKGKVFYLPMRFGEIAYIPDLKPGSLCPFVERPVQLDFFRELLGEIIGDYALLKTDAPPKVYMTVYREKESILIHVLNGTGTGAKHAERITERNTGNPFPPLAYDLHVSLFAPDAKETFAVSPDFEGRRALPLSMDKNGNVIITLPKELLKVYTIIRIMN